MEEKINNNLIKRPKMWIMKIIPYKSIETKKYFKNLFVNKDCKNLIGYTKDFGKKYDDYLDRWNSINIGDLILVIEELNLIHGVVEVLSDSFDANKRERNYDSDWFHRRRKAKLIKYFDIPFQTKVNIIRESIISDETENAKIICDTIWEIIKDDYIAKR